MVHVLIAGSALVLYSAPKSIVSAEENTIDKTDESLNLESASLLSGSGFQLSRQLNQVRRHLHEYLDVDANGEIEANDLKSVAATTSKADDIGRAFEKLDRNQDSIISLQELEERWEAIGAEMTVEEVADWINYSVQLPQYADLFRKYSISGYTFPLLMQNEGTKLREIGIENELHQRQVAMFLRIKYLGLGVKPAKIIDAMCEWTEDKMRVPNRKKQALARIVWVPATDAQQRFRLERRSPGNARWALVYSGPDTEYVDLLSADESNVRYRLTVWNSYGRSPHTFIQCVTTMGSEPVSSDECASSNPSNELCKAYPNEAIVELREPVHHSVSKDIEKATAAQRNEKNKYSFMALYHWFRSTLWWLDDAIALAFFIVLPIRGLIYGDANFFLRILHRLPPNMPTRVVVSAYVEKEPNQHTAKLALKEASVMVLWEVPIDNGVPIVCYTVRWTRSKTEEVQWMKLMTLPLPNTAKINHLRRGETYKFVVEATNSFGLVSQSSRSTYMVPVSEPKGQLYPATKLLKEASTKFQRNQCYMCHSSSKQKSLSEADVLSGDSSSRDNDSRDNSESGAMHWEEIKRKKRFLVRKAASSSSSLSSSTSTSVIYLRDTIHRKILHFCCRCDREFCHYHRGQVYHTKALSCPALDGRCICIQCARLEDFDKC